MSKFIEECLSVEKFAREHGVLDIRDLKGDKVPTYSINMMQLVNEFPDISTWQVDRTKWSCTVVVEFNERKFICNLDNEQEEYLCKRYGMASEVDTDETL